MFYHITNIRLSHPVFFFIEYTNPYHHTKFNPDSCERPGGQTERCVYFVYGGVLRSRAAVDLYMIAAVLYTCDRFWIYRDSYGVHGLLLIYTKHCHWTWRKYHTFPLQLRESSLCLLAPPGRRRKVCARSSGAVGIVPTTAFVGQYTQAAKKGYTSYIPTIKPLWVCRREHLPKPWPMNYGNLYVGIRCLLLTSGDEYGTHPALRVERRTSQLALLRSKSRYLNKRFKKIFSKRSRHAVICAGLIQGIHTYYLYIEPTPATIAIAPDISAAPRLKSFNNKKTYRVSSRDSAIDRTE